MGTLWLPNHLSSMKLVVPVLVFSVLCSPGYAQENYSGIARVFQDKGTTVIELNDRTHVVVTAVIPAGSAAKFKNAIFADGKQVQIHGVSQTLGGRKQIVLTEASQLSIG